MAKTTSKPLCNRFRTSFADQQIFVAKLNRLREEAMHLGLYETGHALHDAVRKVGFEMADILEKKEKMKKS